MKISSLIIGPVALAMFAALPAMLLMLRLLRRYPPAENREAHVGRVTSPDRRGDSPD